MGQIALLRARSGSDASGDFARAVGAYVVYALLSVWTELSAWAKSLPVRAPQFRRSKAILPTLRLAMTGIGQVWRESEGAMRCAYCTYAAARRRASRPRKSLFSPAKSLFEAGHFLFANPKTSRFRESGKSPARV